MGPLLGGGHSVLQGDHGFSADNLVSAKVVLHDGTVVTASATENADLFWGLRGAGHNLGIVLEFEVKVYDIHPDPWTFMTFVYEADRIEDYFNTWNELEDTIAEPGLVVLNGYYRNLPEINAEKASNQPRISCRRRHLAPLANNALACSRHGTHLPGLRHRRSPIR